MMMPKQWRQFLSILLIVSLAGCDSSSTDNSASPPQTSPTSTTGPVTSQTATTSATGFRLALPGYKFQFPRDHASHPEFATEWWYYTGNLRAAGGRQFGYQLTFFRTALTPKMKRASKWATRDVILGHLALTDITGKKFYFYDRVERGAAGVAGADDKTPHVWLNDWDLRMSNNRQTAHASGNSRDTTTKDTPFALELEYLPLKQPVIQGVNGVSQKSEGRGQASHYYSFTRLQTSGTIRVGDERFQVEGESWFDKEFGSNQLAKNQIGWDWFSLQLADGRELMLYQMRRDDGSIDPFSSGTLVEKNGSSRHLRRDDFTLMPKATWKSPTTGATYPSGWTATLPGENITLTIEPQLAAQELITSRSTGVAYWEGSVRLTGTQGGRPLAGLGYVELTGYSGTLSGKF
jgi:predicted secreted hydrolase